MGTMSQRWAEELSRLPAHCLVGLPEACTLSLYSRAMNARVQVFTRELAEPREPSRHVVLDGIEWAALVLGVEADRWLPDDLRALCEAKRSEPSTRLDAAQALDGAFAEGSQVAELSVGQVLDRLALELEGIALGRPAHEKDEQADEAVATREQSPLAA